jgi:hypothetical protein
MRKLFFLGDGTNHGFLEDTTQKPPDQGGFAIVIGKLNQ